MKVLGVIHDPTFVSRPHDRLDRFFLRYVKDERDLPFAYLIARITLILLPLNALLFMPFVTGWVWWAVTIAQLYVSTIMFKGPYGLMLHCTSHRPLFKPEYKWMYNYVTWVLAPFFGQTPETYFSHHMGMHHPENNQEEDESSTMDYQRDSVWGFLHYFSAFLFFGIFGLTSYLRRKNRMKLAYRAIAGEVLFAIGCILLCFVNWPATVVVFILPFVVFRMVAMLGNWTQHAFVDADDPGNAYKNSITCINVKYNHKCWNDGYHSGHHARPALHWTEQPAYFLKTIDKYAQNKAIVFDGIDYMMVFIFLMTKRYDKLAKHVVNINGTFKDDAEIIELLRYRTQRLPVSVPAESIPVAA